MNLKYGIIEINGEIFCPGYTTAVTYVSSKHHDLTLQTMYSGKNKGSLATTPSGKISYSQTSETLSGTASTISLLQENNNVNKKITQSKQFVRWFGDWQNNMKSASKVMDGNGEPLVVYHQTGI